MELVKMGKKWEINTREDYENALKALEDADFCARMCDDYATEQREREEVARQAREVVKMANAKGII